MSISHLLSLTQDHTYVMVILGTAIIGSLAGALGSFAYLRKQSLLADVISHSALPGTLLAFLALGALGFSGRELPGLLIGATVLGVLAAQCTSLISANSPIAPDTAMAVVLSGFFGCGLLLMQYISTHPFPNKGGIQDYLFGNASTITRADLFVSLSVGLGAIVVLLAFWKEITAASFDREHAHLLGFSVRVLDPLIFTLIVVSTVIGLKAVGLVLMVAFVVTPPATARQWARTLPQMIALSAVCGAVSSVVGAYLSIAFGPLPTGPVIVLTLFALFVLSLLLSPRSIVYRAILRRRHLQEALA